MKHNFKKQNIDTEHLDISNTFVETHLIKISLECHHCL
jgi:hypothetical protein